MLERRNFWTEVLAVSGSVTPYVMRRVAIFGLWGALVWFVATQTKIDSRLGVAPYEFIGAVMALLLVLRTNSGYDRWYEGRKLWGGIVNQSRNLGVMGVAYGPKDSEWRSQFLRWTAAFPHLAKLSLRGERDMSELQEILAAHDVRELENANHPPLYGSLRLAQLLRGARDRDQIDGFAFMRVEEQRAQLIDHIGACERIMKTPLAKVVSIKVRRFLFLYLTVLPVAIVDRGGALTPIITMLVAYPLLSLDQIGIELENPFSSKRLSHLPLDRIANDIQINIEALADVESTDQTIRSNGRQGSAAAKFSRKSDPQPVH